MSDNFNEIGFTLQEENVIWGELEKVGLKPGVNEKKTRFEIVTTVVDLKDNLVVRARAVKHRLKAMRDGLQTFLKAYAQDDAVGEVVQLHIADQGLLPTGFPEDERRKLFLSEETQVTHPGFAESDFDTQPADRKDDLREYLSCLLAAVRQAQKRPINPMIAFVQTKDRTKYCVFRLAVWKLLEIFERDTEKKPIVSPNSYAEDGITGNASAFLIACLAPANLIERKVLISNIVRAYREWVDKRR